MPAEQTNDPVERQNKIFTMVVAFLIGLSVVFLILDGNWVLLFMLLIFFMLFQSASQLQAAHHAQVQAAVEHEMTRRTPAGDQAAGVLVEQHNDGGAVVIPVYEARSSGHLREDGRSGTGVAPVPGLQLATTPTPESVNGNAGSAAQQTEPTAADGPGGEPDYDKEYGRASYFRAPPQVPQQPQPVQPKAAGSSTTGREADASESSPPTLAAMSRQNSSPNTVAVRVSGSAANSPMAGPQSAARDDEWTPTKRPPSKKAGGDV